ncbi:uncharacterized protein J7T54_002172 [Emericellopsis cladophorae]|uniref:Uncharacterized protein n=1 Tax=Emericellopsis cladophorae TaxID=2686198 RepID=A0A9P9Y462_9HYPO|nr:uncharacterized protein J7T54_002172 [Emericellopsis cladophorae]KAI6783010.1 hypothetical protein J7T54_002172 [Emericellopsis cladophorae]
MPRVEDKEITFYDITSIVDKASQANLDTGLARSLAIQCLQQLVCVAVVRNKALTKREAIAIVQLQCQQDTDRSPSADAAAVEVESDLIQGFIEDAIAHSDLQNETREQPPLETDTRAFITTRQPASQPSQDPVAHGIDIEKTTVDGRCEYKYKFSKSVLDQYFQGRDPYSVPRTAEAPRPVNEIKRGDLIGVLCQTVELAVEIGKHLRPRDILHLYIASRQFRQAINGYMLSSIRIWINHRCPEAGLIFPFKLYKNQVVPDPSGRTWDDQYQGQAPATLAPERINTVRTVPGLRYLQLVVGRDRYCREIVAIMARSGHRTPKTMYETLLRMWLLLDVSTTEHRRAMLRNRTLWRDTDLYNAQLFFIKLGLHFNDPVYGPCTYDLMHLMLGQKGLYPLWQLLLRKRFTTLHEIIDLKVRYDYQPSRQNWAAAATNSKTVHGVPLDEIGIFHREGWGQGKLHLFRPDELIPIEAVQRGLQLKKHIRHMILWGQFDRITGENLVPTEEEIYISDEDGTLAHMDTTTHWKKKHALKKRWHMLTPEQQDAIREEDEDNRLRCLAWAHPDSDVNSDLEGEDSDSSSTYSLNDEIRRGYIPPPLTRGEGPPPQSDSDQKSWARFVTETLMGAMPEINPDLALKWQGAGPGAGHIDLQWMREEGFDVDDLIQRQPGEAVGD